MFHNIISETEKITKWVVAIDPNTDLTGQPDNVYPFAGGEDQWTVVINETQIAWAAEYGTACMIFITALQTRREHLTRNPANDLGKWWTVRTADFTASVDRETGEVSYVD